MIISSCSICKIGSEGPPYNLDKAAIKQDLTTERPQWILSAYGPGRNAPEQLFGGSTREQSFEEMRLMHYIAAASGNVQPAVGYKIPAVRGLLGTDFSRYKMQKDYGKKQSSKYKMR